MSQLYNPPPPHLPTAKYSQHIRIMSFYNAALQVWLHVQTSYLQTRIYTRYFFPPTLHYLILVVGKCTYKWPNTVHQGLLILGYKSCLVSWPWVTTVNRYMLCNSYVWELGGWGDFHSPQAQGHQVRVTFVHHAYACFCWHILQYSYSASTALFCYAYGMQALAR